MNKGWVIGCGIAGAVVLMLGTCVGIGVLFFSGIFALTQPVVDASELFLNSLAQGKIAEAYSSTADGFRAQQDEAAFARAVKQLGLTDYSSASWSNRQIRNQEGSVEGTVTTKSGDTKPISIRLIREGGTWKVVGVRYGGVELATVRAAPPVPSNAELERMVLETLMEFNKAVRTGDFTAFHGTIADSWKKEASPQQFQKSFQAFLDNKVDLDFIKNVKPRFAPPATVNDKGQLVIAGHYPTEPSRVRFDLKYTEERGTWKLVGISLNVGKEDAKGEP